MAPGMPSLATISSIYWDAGRATVEKPRLLRAEELFDFSLNCDLA